MAKPRKQNMFSATLESYKKGTTRRSEIVRGKKDYLNKKSSAQAVSGTMKGQQVDTSMGPSYRTQRTSTAPQTSVVRQSEDALKKGPDYNRDQKNYGSVDRNVQDYEGAKAPNYTVEKKESATGTLSAKTDSSSDRMSWAREAEKKARKMMGGR